MDKHRAEDCGKGMPATADSAGMQRNVDARRDRSISRQDMTIADPEMTISRSAISLMMVTATSEGVGFAVSWHSMIASCRSLIMSCRSLASPRHSYTLSRRSLPVAVRSLLSSATAVWIETTGVVVIVVRHLGGVWAGLAGVVHVALNRINCEENQENTLVNEFLLLNLHAINFKKQYVIICCR